MLLADILLSEVSIMLFQTSKRYSLGIDTTRL